MTVEAKSCDVLRDATESSPQFDISAAPVVAPRVVPTHGCGGRTRCEAILTESAGATLLDATVTVAGWAKSVRKQGKELIFIALVDGSHPTPLQIVVQVSALEEDVRVALLASAVSTSFKVTGKVVRSPKAGQTYELLVSEKDIHSVKILGTCDASKFPLAKKNHSREYLREIQHLRPRSYLISCVARIRSALAFATHEFFQTRGFQYVHCPLITAADCEGAGEMFQVTTLVPESGKVSEIPADKSGIIDYKKDFFGRRAFLTVSGQLAVETYCSALSDVYTFGPTFRAEMSHTSRHLAEFWMIEPELAFADLEDNMRCAEAYLRFCVQYVLTRHRADLEWLEANVEEGLTARLMNICENNFARVSYTEAVKLLMEQPADKFSVKPEWGFDMGSEHERWLVEEIYKKPCIVYNYPKDIKAFYMKLNEDGKTVRAMDILVPKIGEVIGGSQREEDLAKLDAQIASHNLEKEAYWWYRELREYGTVPHSGFGVGFERLIMLVTGVENIRDVIPFPRYPGVAEF